MTHYDPFQSLLTDVRSEDVFAQLVNRKPEDYEKFADLDEQQLADFSERAAKSICKSGNSNIIEEGYWLHLQRMVLKKSGTFGKFLKEMDIKKTPAYQKMSAALVSAPYLAKSPKLFEQFVPAALFRVCGSQYPQSARNEVFAMAAENRMINIATAEEIRRRHTSDVKSESTNQTVHKEDQQKHEMSEVKQSSIKKISPPLVANCQRRARMIQPERNEPINRSHFYSFKGNVVKLAMDLLVSGSRPDLEAIIADVREMLSDLEGRLVKLNRTRQSRKMEASA